MNNSTNIENILLSNCPLVNLVVVICDMIFLVASADVIFQIRI
jgi:hypothetical protein